MFSAMRVGVMTGKGGLALSTPAVMGFSTWIGDVDTTSHAITMPSGIVADETLLCTATFDGSVTLTPSAGWVTLSHFSSTTVFTTALFKKIAVGADTLTIGVSAAQRGTAITYRVQDADVLDVAHRNISSANYDFVQPSIRVGTGDPGLLGLFTLSTSATGTVSDAPSGMSNLISANPALSDNDGTYSAERTVLGDSSLDSPAIGSGQSWQTSTTPLVCIGNAIGIARTPAEGWGSKPVIVSALTSVHLSEVSTTIQIPAAAIAGDTLIACVSSQAYSSAGVNTSSTGWSRVKTAATASTGTSLSIFTKTATENNALIVTSGAARLKDAIVFCLRNVAGVKVEIVSRTSTVVSAPAVTFAAPTDFLCIPVVAAAVNKQAEPSNLEAEGYSNFIRTMNEGSHCPVHAVDRWLDGVTSEDPGSWYMGASSVACVAVTIAAY